MYTHPFTTSNVTTEQQHAPAGFAGTGFADELPCTAGDALTPDDLAQCLAIDAAQQVADESFEAEMREALTWGREMLGSLRVAVSRVQRVQTERSGAVTADVGYVADVTTPVYAMGHGETPRQAVAALVRELGFGGGQPSRAPVTAA